MRIRFSKAKVSEEPEYREEREWPFEDFLD